MAFTNVQDLQKEIATRQQYGIPVNDLQSQLKSMYANAFNNYKYAQGSAQGPATLQQASTANQTGGVNIAPAIPNPNQTPNPAGQNAGANQEGIVKPKTQAEIEAEAQAKFQKEYDDKIEADRANMEKLKQLRIQNQIAGLRSRYGEVESDIKAKTAQLDPTYEAKKTQASTASKLQAKNFAEFLAARGISRGGQAAQYESDRIANLQNTFNQYDAQKKADSDYYTKQLDSAQSALNRDISMAQNEAEANFLDNFMKYKSDQDVAFRTEKLKREELDYNKAIKEAELLQKQIDAQNKKRADAEAAMIKQETDTYGFNLNDTQRGMLQSFNNAMQDPQFVQMYNKAYNSPGGIAKLIEDAKAAGREDLVEALEGGRFSKVLNEGMTKYGGQYGLPQKWYQNAFDTESKGADARIKMIKSNFAYDLESLGLEKLANEVRNGNLDNVKKEIEVSYLPEEKKAELMNKYANIQQTQTQTQYIPFNAQTSRLNANTSAYSAETARKNYNLNVEKFGEDKQRNLDKQQETAYKDIDDYILNTYTQVDENKRTVMSVQDKKELGAYLDGLAVQGVDVNVVKALRTKYNINN